ncbi:DUF4194 domain-containing protein [Endozoicomonas arenosclerae]|uniref:DUF4194 domain-containing protein n=1 Tax=Endozoicomonas arenosclerae TaxID=1633495 RepID=UPI00078625C8|nr:DUF4194 domain-containing protein [Endozoicomonas arenosclerae]
MTQESSEQASDFFDRLTQPEESTELNGIDALSSAQMSIEKEKHLDLDTEREQDQPSTKKGRLPPEARRAVIRLMRLGVISAKSQGALFNSLCQHEKLVRDHLADMYLRLTLDQQSGIALLQEQDNIDEEDDQVSLITRRTLSLFDSLLLLVLRRFYQDRENSGEQQIFIDLEQIEALLTPFVPLTNSSRTDKRNLGGALDRMKERKILSGSREGERFEIQPVIRYVVNADFLQEMLGKYQSMAEGASDD